MVKAGCQIIIEGTSFETLPKLPHSEKVLVPALVKFLATCDNITHAKYFRLAFSEGKYSVLREPKEPNAVKMEDYNAFGEKATSL